MKPLLITFILSFVYQSSWSQTDNKDSLLVEAAKLVQEADSYMSDGYVSYAYEAYLKSAEIRKEAQGINNVEYVYTILKASQCLATMKNYDDAVKLGTEATEICKQLFGPNDPAYAASLLIVVGFNYQLGNYIEAIKMGTDAIAPLKLELGTESPIYAQLLNLLSICYDKNGNISEAVKLGTEAAEIQKKVLGPEHPDYISSLGLLAGYNSSAGNYKESVRLGTEVVEKQRKILGDEHPDYISSLGLLAGYNSNAGNYKEAIRWGNKAIETLKKIHETEDSEIVTTLLNDVATMYSRFGYYEESILLLTEAIEIEKDNFGDKNQSLYATSLSNLANVYTSLGDYDEAIRLGNEAIEIMKNESGVENLDYVGSLNNLAVSYSDIGNYVEALRLGNEAVELYMNVLGTEHPKYAGSLANLAKFNFCLGNNVEAIKLQTMAMEIEKKILGSEHPDYAKSLNNLAIYKAEQGNYEESIMLLNESLEKQNKITGTHHLDYVISMNNLALYNSCINKYAEAVSIENKAKKILKRIHQIDHPLYATLLDNLARFNYKLGDNVKAVLLETKATEIRKKILGDEHPDYEKSLYNLSFYNLGLCNYTKAKKDFMESLNIKANNVLRNFSSLSSYRRNIYWEKEKVFFLEKLPAFAFKLADTDIVSLLYDKAALLAKGILLNTEIEMKKLIEESHNPELIEDYQKLLLKQEYYNKQSSLPIIKRVIDTDSLKQIIQNLEDTLVNKSKAYGDYMRNLKLTWKDVQQSLSETDLAIEFLDFPVGNDSIMYIALTLKKEYDNPRLVPLFELRQLKGIAKNTYYKSSNLSKLIWGPLKEEFAGVKNVYFSPSGELHNIGIEYLPLNGDDYILDKYKMYRLSSTRQIVLDKKSNHKQAVLYGGIDYEANIASSDEKMSKKMLLQVVGRMNVDSLSIRGSKEYLEGTKIEADNIAANLKEYSWDYNYYSGAKGSEESFKMMSGKSPSLLHIATHGFYMTEEDVRKEREIVASEFNDILDSQHHVIREDKPMTRSGLLMSGCNHTLNHENISENGEDGILTAQEIASLDLRGLDLVVLSACETGLGDIASGEGVFGLQRGFKKAGAKTIMMSLWKVSDKATEILMTTFYRHYLNGMSKYDAFTIARDELRAKYPSRKNKPDWAAFIMLDGVN